MYWDNAATTKPKQEVIDAMMPYFTEKWYNPSSVYEVAREVRRNVEHAREIVASSINAEPEEIYFTSGGSEANNWILEHYGYLPMRRSTIEHSSIAEMTSWVGEIPVDETGKIDVEEFKKQVANDWFSNVTSIQLANNEIGTIQDVKTLVALAHENNVKIHTDAVQAYGKIPIDVKDLDVDFLSASGHKIGAPKGIGFAYVKSGLEENMTPFIAGTQERGFRGGTENVPYIIGLATAVELMQNGLDTRQDYYKEFYNYLAEKVASFATLNGHPTDRLYNIVSLTINEAIDGQQLLGLLHDQGHYVSAGSACNAYSNEPSHVLKAIGLSDEAATRTIRISFGDDVNKNDIDELVNVIRQNVEILKMMSNIGEEE